MTWPRTWKPRGLVQPVLWAVVLAAAAVLHAAGEVLRAYEPECRCAHCQSRQGGRS